MSAIQQALMNLNAKIERLEESIQGYEEITQARVKEAAQAANENDGQSLDPAVVTKKLDSAIQKVEAVLQEAQG